jgi:hypothetical protein
MEMDPSRAQRVPPTRFTARLKVMEEEAIANRLGEMAYPAGHSLSDEIRQALRFWIAQWDETDG